MMELIPTAQQTNGTDYLLIVSMLAERENNADLFLVKLSISELP